MRRLFWPLLKKRVIRDIWKSSKACSLRKANNSLEVIDLLKPQDFRQTGYFVIDDKRCNIQELTCEQIRTTLELGDQFLSAVPVEIRNTHTVPAV